MTTGALESPRERRDDAALWLGIVVPPLAWAADELVGLVFSDFVCDSGHRWLLHAVTAGAFLLAAAAGAISWRAGADGGSEEGGRVGDRRRFMRRIGGLTTVFFLLVIVAGAVPGLLHRPCD